jgi:hypothetical protein
MIFRTLQTLKKWVLLINKPQIAFFFFFFLIFSTNSNLFGQDSTKATIPRFTIKTSPTTFFNPLRSSWQMATDVRIFPRISLDVGIGTFYYSQNLVRYKEETFTGLRTRFGGKYHFTSNPNWISYIGLEAKYHNINNKTFQNVSRQGDQYVQVMLLNRKIITKGIATRVGMQFYYGKNRRFLTDVFTGFGKAIENVKLDVPADSNVPSRPVFINFNNTQPGIRDKIYLIFGVHLGYVIW